MRRHAGFARNIIISFRKTHKYAELAKPLLMKLIAKQYVLSHIITLTNPFAKNAQAIWIRLHAVSAQASSTQQH